MVDGSIEACVSQERFSRKKNDESYPLDAVNSVLDTVGISPKELDLVVIAGERFDPLAILCHKNSNFSVKDRLREQTHYWYPKLYQKKDPFYLDVFKDKLDTSQYPGDWSEVVKFLGDPGESDPNVFFQDFRRRVVARHLGIDQKKIIFTHHHRAHGYYGYYGSPMKKDKTVILTADAWGDDMNASVSVAEGREIKLISSSQNFNLGRIYRYITLLLGMKPDEHEYKVMGLAPYAKERYYQDALKVFKDTLFVDGLGFGYHQIPGDLYFYFKEKLDGVRFDSIAAAIQKYAEDILVQWTTNALKNTGSKRVCFGGGVFMNIKALMEIAKIPQLKEMFVCPTPSDESLAIGSLYVAMHDICLSRKDDPRDYLKPLKNAYLGPQADNQDIGKAIKIARSKGYKIKAEVDLGYVAKLLAKGKIIGRCFGRSEFGARALGNRSILADPRDLNVVKIINEKVKCRDFWMPFAPSVLDNKEHVYFVNPKHLQAPYMTIAFNTYPAAWKDLKASIHQYDLTGRPQVVKKETNPQYYELLNEFEKLAGVGALLNTSFNLHGEPIVQTPEDALSVFQRTELDALLLDGYLIEGNAQNEK
jgi:carbamoyltransferase